MVPSRVAHALLIAGIAWLAILEELWLTSLISERSFTIWAAVLVPVLVLLRLLVSAGTIPAASSWSSGGMSVREHRDAQDLLTVACASPACH